MTSFDVCSKIIKSDDRHPQPMDAQSWYLCKKENIDNAVKLWKNAMFCKRNQDNQRRIVKQRPG